ncbi:MAG: HAD family hydrolase [Lachnospiraceae bacterium]|nr:HAD family hydrolase [Lachnospiraceae bacterium]
MKYETAIFDMDGTVLDTVDDLTLALNYALQQSGHSHNWNREDTKKFFGSGVIVALTRALAVEGGIDEKDLEQVGTDQDAISPKVNHTEVLRIAEIFKPYYADHCHIKTGPYPGIPLLLRRLKEAGVKTAVVSNKPDPAVRTLSAELFPGLFDLAVGEQEGIKRKPAPDMTLKVMEQLRAKEEKTVYIGDSEIDLQTARNSGIDCISVDWGFRSTKFLEVHHASCIVSSADAVYEAICV